MKVSLGWFSLPMAIATLIVGSNAALGQSVTTILATQSDIPPLTGVSGGVKKAASCAEYISAAPNHIVQINEDSNLTFQLEGAPSSTLLITSEKGQSFCVQALSDGKIEIPARWNRGKYSIFVGDRNKNANPYKLSIKRM